MKTKLFIYVITDRKISKTYGGITYSYNVYEVTKGNDLKFITEGKACTRGHKGEDSEAFGKLLQKLPQLKKQLFNRAKKALKNNPENWDAKSLLSDIENSGGYYSMHCETFGVRLRRAGNGI